MVLGMFRFLCRVSLALAAGTIWALVPPAGAVAFDVDRRPVHEAETHRFTSYADVLESARAAVGLVRAESVRRRDSSDEDLFDELFRRFHGNPGDDESENGNGDEESESPHREFDGEPGRPIPHGIGSGVLISASGLMLTNNHVITSSRGRVADAVRVTLEGLGDFEAEVIGRDRRTDIALLKLAGEDFPYLRLADSDLLRIGDIVFAVGNPLGLGQTSTMGIVSATGRTDLGLLGAGSFEDFIQTDAAINRGNSGGALVDAAGRLIGINTAIFSRSGGNIGIGFAVPVNMARQIALELMDHGEVRRGFLGVSIRNVDPVLHNDRSGVSGVYVQRADADLPAGKAGIRRGDIILAIDGHRVTDVNQLRFRIAGYRPGARVDVLYLRDGEEESVTVELSSLDPPLSAAVSPQTLPGIELLPVRGNKDAADEAADGLRVIRVDRNSPYAELLEEGAVILEINDRKVSSQADIADALRPRAANTLRVRVNGDIGYVTLQPR